MNNTMTYKGYTARVEFDPRDNIFVGLVLGIEDTITFHGETVAELTIDFHAAVGHYIVDCKVTGHRPHKPYSGIVNATHPARCTRPCSDDGRGPRQKPQPMGCGSIGTWELTLPASFGGGI